MLSKKPGPRTPCTSNAGLQDRRRHRVHLTGGLLPIPGVVGVLAVHSLPSSCAPERLRAFCAFPKTSTSTSTTVGPNRTALPLEAHARSRVLRAVVLHLARDAGQ